MALVLINDEYLNDIAAAIREKTDGVTTYKPKEMAAAIRTIATGEEELTNIDELIMQNINVGYTNNRVTKIGAYTFHYQTKLTEAHFSNVTIIGHDAFGYCSSLTTVDFPKATAIYSSAFAECDGLTEVIFPSVTSVSSSAFDGCTNLTKIDLPVVEEIGVNAFKACNNLVTVILRADQVVNLKGTFGATEAYDVFPTSAYYYVPSTLVDSYKAHSCWAEAASKIRAIEDYPEITGTEV